ncbi:hypothetical protein GCM10007285_27020 [Stappia taiwanensis]|nr:hypothetical protein GCM10007285_27020 [Stappia taiwanensis]
MDDWRSGAADQTDEVHRIWCRFGLVPNSPSSEDRVQGTALGAGYAETVGNIKDHKMSDIADRVKKIVIEHLGVDAEKVTVEASFIDDLGADSLDTVELVMAFEEEFGVEIPDDAAETILTVGDAVKFLEKAAA